MPLWLPIIAQRVHLVGLHPRFARLVVVRFELDRRPPQRWVELFAKTQTPDKTLADPHVLDGYIQVHARDEALDDDLADVLLQIDVTNRWFDEELRGKERVDLKPALTQTDERLQRAKLRAASLTRDFVRTRLAKAGAWSAQTVFMPCTPSDADLG